MSEAGTERFRSELRRYVAGSPGVHLAGCYPRAEGDGRKRGFARPDAQTLTLLEDDGVLEWREGAVSPVYGPYRNRTKIIDRLTVEPIEPSRLREALDAADRRLTPRQGLFAWKDGRLIAGPKPGRLRAQRVLVFLHGTFSEGSPLLAQVSSTGEGRAFLGRAAAAYGHVLVFNHPTLAVSPVWNAMDLEDAIGEAEAVDIVAHSRGSLVARWWLERIARKSSGRAVLVGAPLTGTSLAAAPNVRRLMSWFSNLALHPLTLSVTASLTPWMAAVAALARFAPGAADGMIALIPGLSSMARVSNNPEVARFCPTAASDRYLTISANFEPQSAGLRLWRRFVDQPRERALHSLFPGPNDTVVDLAAMDLEGAESFCFPRGSTVHHTNYFEQPEMIRQIEKFFDLA